MVRDMCAVVRMEEGYMRTVIEYGSNDNKRKIQAAIETIEIAQNVYQQLSEKLLVIMLEIYLLNLKLVVVIEKLVHLVKLY